MKPLDVFILLTWAIILSFGLMSFVCAQGGVKYCKNLQTGEIIVVEEGYPCPSGTVKIR